MSDVILSRDDYNALMQATRDMERRLELKFAAKDAEIERLRETIEAAHKALNNRYINEALGVLRAQVRIGSR